MSNTTESATATSPSGNRQITTRPHAEFMQKLGTSADCIIAAESQKRLQRRLRAIAKAEEHHEERYKKLL
jgi:rubrerythrin